MAKRIEIDGIFYRMRRGKLVEIPFQWLNKVPSTQTMRKRPSQMTNKLRRREKSIGSYYLRKEQQLTPEEFND